MRLSSANVLHKKNTRNTLTIAQMRILHDLGLVIMHERDSHRDCSFGVEELMQILPACIVENGTMYSLKIYKNVFDVVCIAYMDFDTYECIIEAGCDDAPNTEYPIQSGHLIDLLFETLIKVNTFYPDTLKEYKEKVVHYEKAM